MTGLSVRRADPSSSTDVAALAELRWQWRIVERGGRGMERDDFDRDFAAWSIAHARTNVSFLAHLETRPVGMAWLALIERVPGPDRWERRAGLVQSVFVLAQHRDRGVGAALMAAVRAAADAKRLDYLMVHPSERSFPFYRRHGFRAADGTLELDVARHR